MSIYDVYIYINNSTGMSIKSPTVNIQRLCSIMQHFRQKQKTILYSDEFYLTHLLLLTYCCPRLYVELNSSLCIVYILFKCFYKQRSCILGMFMFWLSVSAKIKKAVIRISRTEIMTRGKSHSQVLHSSFLQNLVIHAKRCVWISHSC